MYKQLWQAKKYIIIFCTCWLWVLGSLVMADKGTELLPPEEAFKAEVLKVDQTSVVLAYQIADGYFLYHHRFQFESLTTGVELGDPIIPAGKKKQDPFFGEVQTHRNRVVITLPLRHKNRPAGDWRLAATSQGCSDIGVCYPPHTQTIDVTAGESNTNLARLVQSVSAEQNQSNLGAEPSTSPGLGQQFLAVDDAFSFEVLPQVNNVLPIRWKVADGYFLYRDKFHFELKKAYGVGIGDVQLPKGKIKNDPYFGETAILRDKFETKLFLTGLSEATEVVLALSYQGCADDGICYPPTNKEIKVNLTPTKSIVKQVAQNQPYLSEQNSLAAALAENSIWLTLLTFFGLGLLLTFTPCVLPMIPILSSLIVGQDERVSTRRAFSISLVYVLAMALTYTLAGIFVGLSGQNVQIWFQTPWVISIFVGLFVLLSLSMFGFYELQMPKLIQNRLTAVSNRQRSGTLVGAAVMGFLSALIVGPCITAPLVAALIYIGQTGDALLGGLALFALSMGMGLPLLIIGTSAGKLLPKAGAWMDVVKSVFGVLMLAMGIWLLDRIVPTIVTVSLASVLLIISSIYMGVLEPLPTECTGWRKLWKGISVVLVLYGSALFISVMMGHPRFISPLASSSNFSAPSPAAVSHELPFRQIKGLQGLQQVLDEARKNQQTVMLDFYADWCITCKEMEQFTLSNPGVQAVLKNTIWLQADVTKNDDVDQALMKKYGVFGPPAILFFDGNGLELSQGRLFGFIEASEFIGHVSKIYGI